MTTSFLATANDTQHSHLMTQPRTLTEYAAAALRVASAEAPSSERFFQEERNVWRPDSWLLQRCWEELADIGAVDEALEVAALAATRNPLILAHAMLRTAKVAGDRDDVRERILSALGNAAPVLMRPPLASAERLTRDRLLFAAATAAACKDVTTTFTFLERLDQFTKPWDDVVVHPEKRELLASVLAQVGPHPLSLGLLMGANRRFGEAGDNLVNKVALAIDTSSRPGTRMLARCVDAMRYAALTTMHSQRMAVAVMARGGVADAVMRQLETIANVQEARRESGLALRKNDQQLLRQVKRPQANADVDFLVYTLQEAIRVMPLRDIDRDQRVALARQLAVLGRQSDGWTAAGAAGTLLDLGAPRLAIEVVDNIAPNDPTRSEGAIALVSGLLAIHEDELATEQVKKALAWARTQEGKNAERATVWGLADVYLKHGRPEEALALLDVREVQPTFMDRLRNRFRNVITDDQLRDDRVRLRAKLQQGDDNRAIEQLLRDLRMWGPRLLEGEGLVNFYLDGLLEPLLAGGRWADVWALLPEIQDVLARVGGDRHTVHVHRAAELLVEHMDVIPPAEQPLERYVEFLSGLWGQDAQRSIWQVVHGIEGSLLLVLALEGPEAVIHIARIAATEGEAWTKIGPLTREAAEGAHGEI